MSSKIFDFLAGGAGKLIESIGGVIDDLHLSKEEKEAFELKVKQLVLQDRDMTEQTIRQEMVSKAEIIKAEMMQGDTYTKRARPTVIYAGLAFIGVNYALFPILYWLIQVITWMTGTPFYEFPEMPQLELPAEFWYTFGGVASVWSIGRTVERRGVSNAFTDLARTVGSGKRQKPSLFDD